MSSSCIYLLLLLLLLLLLQGTLLHCCVFTRLSVKKWHGLWRWRCCWGCSSCRYTAWCIGTSKQQISSSISMGIAGSQTSASPKDSQVCTLQTCSSSSCCGGSWCSRNNNKSCNESSSCCSSSSSSSNSRSSLTVAAATAAAAAAAAITA